MEEDSSAGIPPVIIFYPESGIVFSSPCTLKKSQILE